MVGPAPSWDRISSALLGRILAEAGSPEGAPDLAHDLARLAPEEKEFPAEAFAKVLAEVARDGALLAYGSPFGYRPLRETLAARLERRGVPADADSLLIVNGAQQGLDLITRALVDPGDSVAVENPSYSGALTLLRAHGARLLGVPLDAEGPGPEALRAALAERPKFLYTIPDFQNPTGLLATASRRREVVAAATAAGVLVVEDAFDADLLVEGELPPPLAALAPGHVVHIGTISKALFPGVRVGWISGPREFVHRLAALKRIGELTSPPVLQAALNVFLSRGDYDRHLLRVKARLKARLALAHKTVLRAFPVGTRCDRPLGGWVLWVDLPSGISGRELAEAARGEGVLVSPGGDYSPDRSDSPNLRISVARSSGAELEKALESVGALARTAVRRALRRAPRAEERREEALIQI
jgi:DNA-binding transcriptional MocR family regulator